MVYQCRVILIVLFPATDAFVKAIQLGLGYGMVPELQVQPLLENGTLVDIMPEAQLDVPLC